MVPRGPSGAARGAGAGGRGKAAVSGEAMDMRAVYADRAGAQARGLIG
jgi:hypothetical protein